MARIDGMEGHGAWLPPFSGIDKAMHSNTNFIVPHVNRCVLRCLALSMLVCTFVEAAEFPELNWEGRTLAEHLERLSSADAKVRVSSSQALGAMAILSNGTMRNAKATGAASFPAVETFSTPLLKMIADNDPAVRRMAVSALGWAGTCANPPVGIRQAIIKCMQEDSDAPVRANAVNAFSRAVLMQPALRADPDTRKPLENAMRDADARVRRSVANVFMNHWMGKDLLEISQGLLNDTDELTRTRALRGVKRAQKVENGESWQGTTLEQAIEEFERDPLEFECAERLLRVNRESHRNRLVVASHPPACYRASRMIYWLKSTNSNVERAMLDWSWKYLPLEEQPEAIDDWLRGRLQYFDPSLTAQSGVDLFQERGARIQIHPDEIRALYIDGLHGTLTTESHLKAALLLEMGGFHENARREFARAAGRLAYFQNGFDAAKLKVALTPEQTRVIRQQALQGLVRVTLRLELREDAKACLSLLDEGEIKEELSRALEAGKAPAIGTHVLPWKRLLWMSCFPEYSNLREIKDAQLIPDGLLVCTPYQVWLIDPESGRPKWKWDPENGEILQVGTDEKHASFYVNPLHTRPTGGGSGSIRFLHDGDAPATFKLFHVELKTGVARMHAEQKAHAIYPLGDKTVLIEKDGRFELHHPLMDATEALVLEGVHDNQETFSSAGTDTLLFLRRKTSQLIAVDRHSGKTIWQTVEKPSSIMPLPAHRPDWSDFSDANAQTGQRVYQSLVATLAARDRTTGKHLWSYTDLVLTAELNNKRTWVRGSDIFQFKGKDILCAIYPDSGIAVLDAKTGTLLWRLNLRLQYHSYGLIQGPVLASNVLTGNQPALWIGMGAALIALDPLTGHTLWSTPISQPMRGYGSPHVFPFIFDASRVLVFTSGGVEALRVDERPKEINEENGELWSRSNLLKEVTTKNQPASVNLLIGLGLARDPEIREELLKCFRDGSNISLLPHAAPYSQKEFEEIVLPYLSKLDSLEEEPILALSGSATPAQVAALDKLREDAMKLRKTNRIGFAQSQSIEANLRDAQPLLPVAAPSTTDDF